MPIKNPNSIRNKIHSSFDKSLFSSAAFETEIRSLSSDYPSSVSTNAYMYTSTIQELNRKYSNLGLNSLIKAPVDAGFRPLNLKSFFGSSIALQNGSRLLAEDSSALLLQPSN